MSITLQQTINWALPFIGYTPLTIGSSNEPAITNANTILQAILAPPFGWRWNRNTTTFATVQGQQDYTVSVSDFAFLETASAAIGGSLTFPLEIKRVMSEATEQSRPEFISVHKEPSGSSVTFRLLPVPEQAYTVTLNYQKKATLFTSTTSTWDPIPDEFSFIFNWGFLSMAQDFAGRPAAQRSRQLFVAALLSVAEGLDESERNLFIASWLGEQHQMTSASTLAQVGWKARAI